MSLVTGEAVVMIEGEIEQASLLQALSWRTTNADILNPATTMDKYLEEAGELQTQLVAPNQDEIDRATRRMTTVTAQSAMLYCKVVTSKPMGAWVMKPFWPVQYITIRCNW